MIIKYDHKIIESYVQEYWEKNKTFKTIKNSNKKKYYCLSMFPYTSGDIHVGHIRNYTIGDIISRFNRMCGKNVLYPIGWDSFGLPAENASIKNNLSPKEWTFKNILKMKTQLKSLGFSFDWSKEIYTCSSKYYKWEQWFFKILFKKKLVYKKYSYVNWCPLDKTVLSNEQVIDNKCWICKSCILKKKINQWFIKITNYANKLLYGLDKLKFWPENVKKMQRNWIGKLEWIEIKLKIVNFLNEKYITIFVENIFDFINLNFLVISFENKIAKKFFSSKKNININDLFINNETLETNLYVEYYLINKKIKIKISNNNYILNNILFNKINNLNKFKNNFKINIFNEYEDNNLYRYKKIILNYAFCIINKLKKDIKIDIKYIIKKDFKKKIDFNIKDWCISRQRYWGVPIPMAKLFNTNIIVPIPNKYLPINLCKYEKNKINTEDKNLILNNKILIKESDTLDTFVQSSWYYARYTCPKYSKGMLNKELVDYWLPIDQYIGGIEHSTMHLIYIRFFNKLMKDANLIKYSEPIKKLLCQGMILSKTFFYIDKNKNKIWVSPKDVKLKLNNNNNKLEKRYLYLDKIPVIYDGLNKMSKSKNNGINPDYLVDKYGSDSLRLFIIFSAPSDCDFIWEEKNIIGIYRFLNKIWTTTIDFLNNYKISDIDNYIFNLDEKHIIFFNNIIHNVTNDIKNKQKFNSSIALLMEFTNKLILIIEKNIYNKYTIKKILTNLIKLLYPFAPHISFVLWEKLGYKNKIDYELWPKKEIIKKINKIDFLLLINNKFISKLDIPINSSKDFIINFVKNNFVYLNLNKYENFLRVIFIKNKLINIIFNKVNNDVN